MLHIDSVPNHPPYLSPNHPPYLSPSRTPSFSPPLPPPLLLLLLFLSLFLSLTTALFLPSFRLKLSLFYKLIFSLLSFTSQERTNPRQKSAEELASLPPHPLPQPARYRDTHATHDTIRPFLYRNLHMYTLAHTHFHFEIHWHWYLACTHILTEIHIITLSTNNLTFTLTHSPTIHTTHTLTHHTHRGHARCDDLHSCPQGLHRLVRWVWLLCISTLSRSLRALSFVLFRFLSFALFLKLLHALSHFAHSLSHSLGLCSLALFRARSLLHSFFPLSLSLTLIHSASTTVVLFALAWNLFTMSAALFVTGKGII